MSQLVEEALWESLRSLPPNDAIVALVCTDIIVGVIEEGWVNLRQYFEERCDVVGWRLRG